MTQPVEIASLVLKQVGTLLAKLTPDQLDGLLQSRGQLVYHEGDVIVPVRATRSSQGGTAGSRTKPPNAGVDIDAVVAAIRACATGAEVQAYLDSHNRELTVPTLRAVAKALGPTVVSSGNKPDLKRNIIAGTAGFRERSDAMSAGAWRT